MEMPSYYAILPASIRYDKEITDFGKIIYAEISALSNKFGFCTATNGHFAELYDKSESTISETISGLQKRKHIYSEVEEGFKRKIYPLVDPIPKKPRGGTEKAEGGYRFSGRGGTEKAEHNNTSSNTTINTGNSNELRVVISEEDSPKGRGTSKYPHKKEVYGWFPGYEKFWDRHATFCEYSNDCWELGEKTCRAMIKFYEENKHDPHCPIIITPYDVVTKRKSLQAFRDRS